MSKKHPAKTTRCVIYTRCASSQNDNEALNRQQQVCRDFITARHKQGWTYENKTYSDDGVSGLAKNRQALNALLHDAKQGAFDIVMCESIDRISRDYQHYHDILDTLKSYNIEMVSVIFGQESG